MAIGGDFTLRLFKDAGVGSGMRVLDVGCGTGDVSLLAAELVGASGSVLGLDREIQPIDAARGRAKEADIENITFMQGDLSALPDDIDLFDAIVGRRVLMYQADTVQAVRGLLPVLRPGGLVVFHEHDTTMVPASPQAMPLHLTVQNWLKEMLKREGADLSMGFNLYDVLTRAGLMVDHVRAEAIVQTPTQKYPVAMIVSAILPRIIGQGVATEEEVDIDTLDERLDRERRSTGATYVADMMFGVWARKPE